MDDISTSATSVADKTVLVTGGTGSFGQTVARHLLTLGSRQVRILSRDEEKQYYMRFAFGDPRLDFRLGDVRDFTSVRAAMEGVDLVFHAAALKQVPSCEIFPEQAVMTNVLGSHNVIRNAIEFGVKKVVCLSTDKAVYPVNAMGMTKGLMEKMVQAEARKTWRMGGTVLCCVRYGNVLCSRGSVVPLFVSQMKAGKPITITVAEMTRFLLTLNEAVELVELALTQGRPGDLFIRKAPACTIAVLAEAVQQLLGVRSPIVISGARPGEKMHETLATVEEMRCAEDLGDHWRIPLDKSDLIDGSVSRNAPYQGEDYTSANTARFDLEETKDMLMRTQFMQDAVKEWRAAPVAG